MKNVQIIDGARNCTYSIYAFTDKQFSMIFPGPGQDIEFIKDVCDRLDEAALDKAFEDVWTRLIQKPDAMGIHGTLFYELDEEKRSVYPTKSELDVAGPPHSAPIPVSGACLQNLRGVIPTASDVDRYTAPPPLAGEEGWPHGGHRVLTPPPAPPAGAKAFTHFWLLVDDGSDSLVLS